MNEFYINYKEAKMAFAEYQQKVENFEKSYSNIENRIGTIETISKKANKLQDTMLKVNSHIEQTRNKGVR